MGYNICRLSEDGIHNVCGQYTDVCMHSVECIRTIDTCMRNIVSYRCMLLVSYPQ